MRCFWGQAVRSGSLSVSSSDPTAAGAAPPSAPGGPPPLLPPNGGIRRRKHAPTAPLGDAWSCGRCHCRRWPAGSRRTLLSAALAEPSDRWGRPADGDGSDGPGATLRGADSLMRPPARSKEAAEEARVTEEAGRGGKAPSIAIKLNRRLRQARSCQKVMQIVGHHFMDFDFINCSTAMSRLGHLSGRLSPRQREELCNTTEFQLLLGEIENQMWDFGPQAMSNTIWALGRLSHYPSKGVFLEILVERALWCLNDFKPQELANIAWGLAGVRPPRHRTRSDGNFDWAHPDNAFLVELLMSVAEQAQTILFEFQHKELCNLTWAFGRLDFYHPHFMRAMAARTLTTVHEYNDQDVSTTAWACSALRFYDSALLDCLAQAAETNLPAFSPQATVNTLQALVSLGHRPQSLLEAVADRVASSSLDRFSQQQLCNLAWSLAVARMLTPETAQVLCRAVARGPEETLSPIDSAQLFYAGQLMSLTIKMRSTSEGMGLSQRTWEAMALAWQESVAKEALTSSSVQEEVHDALNGLKISHEVNHVTRDGILCVGLAIVDSGLKVAVEAEAAYCSTVNAPERPLGARRARWGLLEARGWTVVVVSGRGWQRLPTEWEKASYLMRKLRSSGVLLNQHHGDRQQ